MAKADAITQDVPEAQAVLDIGFAAIDLNHVDPNQPLQIPNNPLHHKAHRLQLLLERLDKQAANRASQFSSINYLQILNEYYACIDKIKDGHTLTTSEKQPGTAAGEEAAEVLDAQPVGGVLPGQTGPRTDGAALSDGLDLGVPAENPFSREGVHSL